MDGVLLIKLDGFDNARVVYETTKPTMIPKRVIDPSKAKALLGFEMKTQIEEGLKKTIECYRSSRGKLKAKGKRSKGVA